MLGNIRYLIELRVVRSLLEDEVSIELRIVRRMLVDKLLTGI